MTTPRLNAHLFKAIADGYRVERLANHGAWINATISDLQDNPNGEFRIPVVSIETRKFRWYASGGRPCVCIVTRAENDAEPRDKWAGFYGWAGGWEAHNMPARKGDRHLHADMIHAWADGAQMRWRVDGERVCFYETGGGTPRFSPGYTYEVAPTVVRSRRALARPSPSSDPTLFLLVEGQGNTPGEFERLMGACFIEWIDNAWQTHEVPGGAA
jgi:hypothetical protein